MQPLYEEFDDFDDFDFSDTMAVERLLREQRREQRLLSRRRFRASHGPRQSDDELGYEDADDYIDFDDYNDEEFDRYAGLDLEH